MNSLYDVLEVLHENLSFINERQEKARGIDTATKLMDRAIATLKAIEYIERRIEAEKVNQ